MLLPAVEELPAMAAEPATPLPEPPDPPDGLFEPAVGCMPVPPEELLLPPWLAPVPAFDELPPVE
jgi:hypothetical protein